MVKNFCNIYEYVIKEECSMYTNGAIWNYGGDYYEIIFKVFLPELIYMQIETGEEEIIYKWLELVKKKYKRTLLP